MENLLVESFRFQRRRPIIRFCDEYNSHEVRKHTLQYLQDVFKEPLLVKEESIDSEPESHRYFITPPSSSFKAHLLLYEPERSISLELGTVHINHLENVSDYAERYPLCVKIPKGLLFGKIAAEYFVNSFEGGNFALRKFYNGRNRILHRR